ncbi:MAG: sugar kinase [Chloroflexota bacterium]|nr:sugar kinase [Chloroflexota bacterium]
MDRRSESPRVVSLGEVMIRYSPPGKTRLEEATVLEVRAAGAEANFAAVYARLGLNAAWISRLTDNPLGRLIERSISRYGVDTSHIIWTDQDRVGTYYIEFGSPPRPTRLLYDRRGSAISRLRVEEMDWAPIRDSALFHITGITPALSDSCRQVTLRAIEEAHAGGALVSFDLNYRSKLWTPEEAEPVMRECFAQADIVFCSPEEAELIFGLAATGGQGGGPEAVLEWIAEEFHPQVAVLKMGSEGAVAWQGGALHRVGVYPTETVDPIGTGDAFVGGFVYGYLTGDVRKALRYGAAIAALKRTIPGDIALVTLDEVEELLSTQDQSIRR